MTPACWKLVAKERQQNLEGPFECSKCHGQVMLDADFILLTEKTWCPYCGSQIDEVSVETATSLSGFMLKNADGSPKVTGKFVDKDFLSRWIRQGYYPAEDTNETPVASGDAA